MRHRHTSEKSTLQRPGIEALEPRQLLTVTMIEGHMMVEATDLDDTIRFYLQPGDKNTLVISEKNSTIGDNPKLTYVDLRQLTLSVKNIFVFGGGGSDDIQVDERYGRINLSFSMWGQTRSDGTQGPVGSDTLRGGNAHDYIIGGDGNDKLLGAGGSDWMDGGVGDDSLNSGSGNDYLHGSIGNDTLKAGGGNDTLVGDDGNDSFSGGAGNDVLYARDDTFTGGPTDTDVLNGDIGNDTLYGCDGNDLNNGGDGNDYLFGMAGNDTLLGGFGNDQLFGGIGDDSMNGGRGNDSLNGGGGVGDTMVGGSGVDTFDIRTGNSRSQAVDFQFNVDRFARFRNTADVLKVAKTRRR